MAVVDRSPRREPSAPDSAWAASAWPLVGRDAELRLLERTLREGAGAVVAGVPGVGKTRLLREAAATARDGGASVERIVASRSAASIPLGAFAHLRPDIATARGDDHPLGALRRELVRRSAGVPLVLVVDDAHAVDTTSAALVHQLVAADEGQVLVALRSREPVPDAIVALWKDDLCERVELQPLRVPRSRNCSRPCSTVRSRRQRHTRSGMRAAGT